MKGENLLPPDMCLTETARYPLQSATSSLNNKFPGAPELFRMRIRGAGNTAGRYARINGPGKLSVLDNTNILTGEIW
jgi:hypothetical protein